MSPLRAILRLEKPESKERAKDFAREVQEIADMYGATCSVFEESPRTSKLSEPKAKSKQAILSEDLSVLNINAHTRSALQQGEMNKDPHGPIRLRRCYTVRDVTQRTEEQLLRLVGVGKKSIQEIRAALADYGLKLKGD